LYAWKKHTCVHLSFLVITHKVVQLDVLLKMGFYWWDARITHVSCQIRRCNTFPESYLASYSLTSQTQSGLSSHPHGQANTSFLPIPNISSNTKYIQTRCFKALFKTEASPFFVQRTPFIASPKTRRRPSILRVERGRSKCTDACVSFFSHMLYMLPLVCAQRAVTETCACAETLFRLTYMCISRCACAICMC